MGPVTIDLTVEEPEGGSVSERATVPTRSPGLPAGLPKGWKRNWDYGKLMQGAKAFSGPPRSGLRAPTRRKAWERHNKWLEQHRAAAAEAAAPASSADESNEDPMDRRVRQRPSPPADAPSEPAAEAAAFDDENQEVGRTAAPAASPAAMLTAAPTADRRGGDRRGVDKFNDIYVWHPGLRRHVHARGSKECEIGGGERPKQEVQLDYLGVDLPRQKVDLSKMREVTPAEAYLRDTGCARPNDFRKEGLSHTPGGWPELPKLTWCRTKPKPDMAASPGASTAPSSRRPLLGLELCAGTGRLSKQLVRHGWDMHLHDQDASIAEFDGPSQVSNADPIARAALTDSGARDAGRRDA